MSNLKVNGEESNFHADEMACKCPNEHCDMKDGSKIDMVFLGKLQAVREVYGRPMIITSGLRCADWNKHEGGKPDSAHTKGLAVDIECLNSRDRYDIVSLARSIFGRIGIATNFIHVDADESKSQDVMWVY